jgi:hypothetical protein
MERDMLLSNADLMFSLWQIQQTADEGLLCEKGFHDIDNGGNAYGTIMGWTLYRRDR